MVIRQEKGFAAGYTPVTRIGGDGGAGIDFGILRLSAGEVHAPSGDGERAYLLLSGAVSLEWENQCASISRGSFFDEAPWCLHLPAGAPARIEAGETGAELAVHGVENPRRFPPRLYDPEDCRSEERGKGTMGETSTRIVRTIIEDSRAPHSNLVLGEVVTFPGKWSSYPPHHHPQPEIYHYRFLPANGFGLAVLGPEACIVRDGDTVLIPPGAVHPQAAAPGYAMYYIWVIRHLEGERYGEPTFEPEHRWVTDPRAEIWPQRR